MKDLVEMYVNSIIISYCHDLFQGERVLGFAFKELPNLLREEQARDPLYHEKLKDNLIGKVSN